MRRRELIGSLLFVGGCTCSSSADAPDATPPGDRTETGTYWTASPTGSTGETGTREPGWVAVGAGHLESCGLLEGGRLVCWGYPDYVAATPEVPLAQLSVGVEGGCGLGFDGAITCWCPATGTGDEAPCTEAPTGDGFVEVRVAYSWACAEHPDQLLACWGYPNSIVSEAPEEPVLDWAIEDNVGCAVLLDESVTCWGGTEVWELADPDPPLAPPSDLKYTQVAVGRDHACALDTAGEVHCWGSTQLLNAFPAGPASPGPWDSIVAFNYLACALRADGTTECFGDPTLVYDWWQPPEDRWASLTLGEFIACGLTLDGRALCFPEDADRAGETVVPDLADL